MWKNQRELQAVILLLALLPLLSGCWDSQEIEQRANVLAIGIDIANEEDRKQEDEISHLSKKFQIPDEEMIKVTAQIAIPGRIPLGPQQPGGSVKPVLVVETVGHTLEDAMLNLQQEVADEVFLGHLRVMVLSEEIARKGTARFNDFLRRNPEIRRTTALVVSKEPAAKYMNLNPELERIPSLYLADIVDNLSAIGKFPPSFIGLFWTIYSSKGQDPYLPYLALKGKSTIQLNGLAYFNDDKMVGKTTPLEIGIFMAVRGISRGGYGAFVEVPGEDESVLVRAVSRKTKTKVTLKNGRPHVSVKIQYEAEIDEKESASIQLSNSAVLKKIEEEASKSIKKSIEKLIVKTQKSKSDIFGFGEHFRAKIPEYWNKNINTKDKWEEIYQTVTFDIKVDSHIHRVGMKSK
ncbi:Ger(x)C family spore germination protein [Neobacillus sp. YX16]|uniref:Ger(x)C family spore germination protein n=1 Tax=Neobacillus sp. YX16 TaxID=3047874 RepID=UPI0024C350D3|nr:Ger(x)C family spore germination protein [Neobacillus sp. YX16]WHZ05483.1 Ger(x)C family spore germination protein [Neobacillus sp. YX16]